LKKQFPGDRTAQSAVDARVARLRFERAAHTYAKASRLEAEVGGRMLERLDYLKIAPRRILDAGSGPAREARGLQSRYGNAQILSLDFSLGMLRAGRSLFFEKKKFICGDLSRLPLGAGSVDFVWSNMALHWVEDPLAAFKEAARVLAAEGLLMFSTLGPDTLKELRVAAGTMRVHEFIDMHDLGDMLVAAGFAAPVVDMELLTFTYRDGAALLADLRAGGQTNARRDRPRGLAGRGFLTKIRERMQGAASFEVVYGHAWKGAPRKLADGRDIVEFQPKSRPLS
jgi:malonyl-CoA O-methyltransferase